jgi:hypothetical protein
MGTRPSVQSAKGREIPIFCSAQAIMLRAIAVWTLARFMLAAGRIDNYKVKYSCIGVLPAALLCALRVVNECKCLLGRLGYHLDLLRALLCAR